MKKYRIHYGPEGAFWMATDDRNDANEQLDACAKFTGKKAALYVASLEAEPGVIRKEVK